MTALFEGRLSDSAYIEMVWRGWVEEDYSPVCPADTHWNFLFTKYQGEVQVSVEGATTQYVPKKQFQGAEFLVIKFKLGVYMPDLPAANFVNGDTFLPEASNQSFWLKGSTWQLPDYNNVETFVEWLAREDLLVYEPVVNAILQEHKPDVSSRTIRRRFLQATGLTPKTIQQIERAQNAASMLENGISILDTTYELAYSDQAHLTRSLKRFLGLTPAQIVYQSESA
jgi:hypothetical protein